MSDIILKEFYLGFIRIHILYHASKQPVYGVALMSELSRHGYAVGPGTLYPALHRLEKQGYLQRERRLVAGKVRKYYRITESGTVLLEEARVRIMELVDEVLNDYDPEAQL